jgi:hypothetical protein
VGVFEWGFEKRRLFGVVFWMVNRGDLVVSCGVLDGAFSEAKNTPIFEIYFWDGQSSIRMWDWLTGWGGAWVRSGLFVEHRPIQPRSPVSPR